MSKSKELKDLKNAIIDKYNNGKKIHPNDVFKFAEAYYQAYLKIKIDIVDDTTIPLASSDPAKDIFINGCNWYKQQLLTITSVEEKMYSKIETLRIANKAVSDYLDDNEIMGRKFLLIDNWIKENL